MDRATSSQYEIIGICEDGFNPLHEPVECSASDIMRRDDKVEFLSTCYVKDYPADKKSPATIISRGPDSDSISLSIDLSNYSLSGTYLRCSKTYECQHLRTTQPGSGNSGGAAAPLDRDSCARILNTVYSCKTAPHCQYASMIEWLPQSDQEYLAQIEAGSMFRIVDFERICRDLCKTKLYDLRPTRTTLCGY